MAHNHRLPGNYPTTGVMSGLANIRLELLTVGLPVVFLGRGDSHREIFLARPDGPALYSCRSAVCGFKVVARLAGIQHANNVTAARNKGTVAKVIGSWEVIPYSTPINPGSTQGHKQPISGSRRC